MSFRGSRVSCSPPFGPTDFALPACEGFSPAVITQYSKFFWIATTFFRRICGQKFECFRKINCSTSKNVSFIAFLFLAFTNLVALKSVKSCKLCIVSNFLAGNFSAARPEHKNVTLSNRNFAQKSHLNIYKMHNHADTKSNMAVHFLLPKSTNGLFGGAGFGRIFPAKK